MWQFTGRVIVGGIGVSVGVEVSVGVIVLVGSRSMGNCDRRRKGWSGKEISTAGGNQKTNRKPLHFRCFMLHSAKILFDT